jgi:hypothetical protein
MTPVAAVITGLLAGAAGTVCLDALHYLIYRRAGGTDRPLAWEFAPVESWETAPDPGQVAKRVIEGFTQRKLPDRPAWLTSTIAHWAYGSAAGAAYGILARRSLAAPLRVAVGVIHHDQHEGECEDWDDDDGDEVGCGSCHVGDPFETTVSVWCGTGQIAPVKTLVLYPWEYRGTPRPATLAPRPGTWPWRCRPPASGGVMKLARDPLLRRSVCAAGQPACPQVSRGIGLSGSDREFPALTGRSGTSSTVPHDSWHPVAARTVQGWPASGPGRLPPGPWFLTGGGAEAPALKGWVPKMRSAKRFERIFGCPLTVEGHPDTERAIPGDEPAAAYAPSGRATSVPSLLIRRLMPSVQPVRQNPYPQVRILLGVRHRRHSPVPSGQSVRKL